MATQVQRGEVTRVAFFADLVRCETRLYNQFNDELRAAYGIVTSQYEFLIFLRDHDSPRTTDMAAEFAIGVGAASKAMDRLEAHGWVTRQPNPANRRSTILTLTAAGRKLVDQVDRTFRERLAILLRPAGTARELEVAALVMARLRAQLEEAGYGTPAG